MRITFGIRPTQQPSDISIFISWKLGSPIAYGFWLTVTVTELRPLVIEDSFTVYTVLSATQPTDQ